MNNVLLPTSLVGSYVQPDWLIDRKKLADRFPPRVRARELKKDFGGAHQKTLIQDQAPRTRS